MSQINIIEDGGQVEVWFDTEGCEMDGTIIGLGDTKAEALTDAIGDLEARLRDLHEMREQEKAGV